MRTVVAIALLLGCCGMDVWFRFENTAEKLRWWGQGNVVSRASSRFNAMRSHLPRHGTVGYQFHGEDTGIASGAMLARYHLAPLIVTTTDSTETPDLFLDDDGKTVSIRGRDPHVPPSAQDRSPPIEVLWLLWAWGLPFFAMIRLLKAFAQPPEGTAAPATAWGLSLWIMGVSLGASMGLSSTLFALWSILFGEPTWWYFMLESVFWIGILATTVRRTAAITVGSNTPFQASLDSSLKTEGLVSVATADDAVSGNFAQPAPTLNQGSKINTIFMTILLAVFFLITLFECVIWNERCPHGINDAVMIWNLRARFMHRSPGDWSDAFSSSIWHSDYPLLLPASVARGWYYTNSESVLVPLLISDLFLMGLVTILGSAALMVQGRTAGFLMAIIGLSSPEILLQGMSQIADLPFAFFVAVTITSWVIARRWPPIERAAWLAFGISLGAALWLKNEGITWAALGLLIVIAVERQRWNWDSVSRFWLPLTVGSALFLAAWATFRLCFPTTNDLIAGQGSSTVSRLIDGTRHWQILSAVLVQFLQVGPGLMPALCVYSGMMGFTGDTKKRLDALGPSFLLSGQFLIYYLVYLTSPHELNWHLSTSLDRLSLHLWPATAFLLFVLIRSPAERFAYDAARHQQRLDLQIELQRS